MFVMLCFMYQTGGRFIRSNWNSKKKEKLAPFSATVAAGVTSLDATLLSELETLSQLRWKTLFHHSQFALARVVFNTAMHNGCSCMANVSLCTSWPGWQIQLFCLNVISQCSACFPSIFQWLSINHWTNEHILFSKFAGMQGQKCSNVGNVYSTNASEYVGNC